MTLARRTAYDVLMLQSANREHPRESLDEVFRFRPTLADRDKAFCRQLVYGTIQHLNTLDWALNLFSETPIKKLSAQVRCVLRLGAYQLLFMHDRVPAYAAVNESVDIAKKGGGRGRTSFVNAILRRVERERHSLPWPDEEKHPVQALSLRYSHPEWLVRRWLDRWGIAQTTALLKKNNEVPPFSIRVNRLKVSSGELQAELRASGFEVVSSPFSPDGLRFASSPSLTQIDAFQHGRFLVQDEASQLVARTVDPQPGETIMDLCASPGGKCTHLAELMADQGSVLAFDLGEERLRLLRQTLARMGTKIVQPRDIDGREAGKRYPAQADRVLVDAPCSGLGILRRKPDLRWNKDYDRVIRELVPLQKLLLESGATALKENGIMVYSTCTTEPEENQKVIGHFLRKHPEFIVEPVAKWVPKTLAKAATPEGFLQLLPHQHDTDGFFIARLKKGKQ